MKKKEIITTTDYVYVSDADIVQDFMENEFYVVDWESKYDVDDYDYFWEDFELTDEDKIRIFKLIEVEAEKKIENYKEQEKQLLKDRGTILDFIYKCIREYSYPEPGEVGYLLSDMEILDLILENGRK